jgi:putative membrane protein
VTLSGGGSSIPRAQWAMLAALLLLLALAQVDQPYPNVAPLHHLPTLALLLAAPFLLRRWPLSDGSAVCIALFLALHTVGGRYTYWNVPYDAWSEALLGRSLGDALGFTRNHYDRFVHLAYGLLAVRPVSEGLGRYGRISPRPALWLSLAIVTSLSAFYEMFEWLLTLVVAGPMAADYNGQQGDMWDAQKDMVLALLGALASATVLALRACRPNSEAGSTGRPGAG